MEWYTCTIEVRMPWGLGVRVPSWVITLYFYTLYMSLLEQLMHDYKEAMKAKDDTKKTVLNLVLAKIKKLRFKKTWKM